MANEEEGLADLHLRCLEYRPEYLANFMSTTPLASRVENRLTQESFPNEAACLESLFSNNQALMESLYPTLGHQGARGRSQNKILSSAEVGVVRLPLAKVRAVCQVGTNISSMTAVPVLVVGQKVQNGEKSDACYLVTLSHGVSASGRASPKVSVKLLDSSVFGQVALSDIQAVYFDESSA